MWGAHGGVLHFRQGPRAKGGREKRNEGSTQGSASRSSWLFWQIGCRTLREAEAHGGGHRFSSPIVSSDCFSVWPGVTCSLVFRFCGQAARQRISIVISAKVWTSSCGRAGGKTQGRWRATFRRPLFRRSRSTRRNANGRASRYWRSPCRVCCAKCNEEGERFCQWTDFLQEPDEFFFVHTLQGQMVINDDGEQRADKFVTSSQVHRLELQNIGEAQTRPTQKVHMGSQLCLTISQTRQRIMLMLRCMLVLRHSFCKIGCGIRN